MKVVCFKAAEVKSKMSNVVDCLRRNTFHLYASIRRSVDQSQLAIASRLKEIFDCVAKEL